MLLVRVVFLAQVGLRVPLELRVLREQRDHLGHQGQVDHRALPELLDQQGQLDLVVPQERCTHGRVLGKQQPATPLTIVWRTMVVVMSVYRAIPPALTRMSLGWVQTGRTTGTYWLRRVHQALVVRLVLLARRGLRVQVGRVDHLDHRE